MKNSSGFTLIELIAVIVILGILAVTAAPRFVDLSDEARTAAFRGTAAAFRDGVKQINYAWIIRGNGQAQQDFIAISDPDVGGDLSVNSNGFPADTRETSLTLNSKADCVDVWKAVLVSQDATVEDDDSGSFDASYNGDNNCTYTLDADDALTVDYDSVTGVVDINF